MPVPALVLLGLPAVAAIALFRRRRRGGSVHLSEHFALSELTDSTTAREQGIDNTPGSAELLALQALAIELLEPIRAHVGRAVHVSSGYRAPALNAAVGGEPTSAHPKGYAADIYVNGMSSAELHQAVYELHQAGELPELGEAIHYDPSRSSTLHVAHKDSGAGDGEHWFGPPGSDYLDWP